jgi:hypothetical protein
MSNIDRTQMGLDALKIIGRNVSPTDGYFLENTQDAMTALAGGGQTGATQITAQMSRFTTVATAADSGKLPPAIPGLQITVTNASAASMNLYPFLGDAINALGANAAFALATVKTAIFTCYVAGQWHSLLSA